MEFRDKTAALLVYSFISYIATITGTLKHAECNFLTKQELLKGGQSILNVLYIY